MIWNLVLGLGLSVTFKTNATFNYYITSPGLCDPTVYLQMFMNAHSNIFQCISETDPNIVALADILYILILICL